MGTDQSREAGLEATNGHFVVEIVSARGVPPPTLLSRSRDPLVRLTLLSSDGQPRGSPVQTPYRRDTIIPVWHSFRDLRVTPQDGDVLRVQLLDHSYIVPGSELVGSIMQEVFHRKFVSKTVLLGETDIALVDLTEEPQPYRLRVQDSTATCTVTLRRLYASAQVPRLRTVFFVRHGESRWNRATEEKNLKGLMAFDHGLSQGGVVQVLEFRKRWLSACERSASPASADTGDQKHTEDLDDEQLFCAADAVFSSPLTRAAETAVLGLSGHPTAGDKARGITMLRSAREIRRMGGLDTVGDATGPGIVTRTGREIESVLGADEAARFLADVHVNPYDAVSPWWTPVTSLDTPKVLARRFEDFMCTLRYYPYSKAVIIVGHSLFFRELCRQCVSDTLRAKHPVLAQDMTTLKLQNAGCLKVVLDFSPWDRARELTTVPEIVDARVLFGSGFASPTPKPRGKKPLPRNRV